MTMKQAVKLFYEYMRELLGDNWGQVVSDNPRALLDAIRARNEELEKNALSQENIPPKGIDTQALGPPAKPQGPPAGSEKDEWFDFYHDMRKKGFHITLGDLSRLSGWSENTLKHAHLQYKAERGIT